MAAKLEHHRKYHQQSLPHKIFFKSEEDFLRYIGKREEARQFKETLKMINNGLPQLFPWFRNNPLKAIKHIDQWNGLIEVCLFFIKNPKPGLYIREIPLQVHTKFIENNKGILRELLDYLLPPERVDQTASQFEKRFHLKYDEPLIRIRLLDEKMRKKIMSISDLSIPFFEFKRLEISPSVVVITENKMNFLTLPLMDGRVVIFGKGFQVNLLKEVDWLKRAKIYYWGDIDAQGFQILSQLRGYFPHAQSLMMDRETFDNFQHFSIEGTPGLVEELSHITSKEKSLYTYIYKNNLRLEQEKISHVYVLQMLTEAIGGN